MESNSFEMPKDPHEVLGIPEGASPELIKGAYSRKERVLTNKKNEGQLGKGTLVAENDFEELKNARDILMDQVDDDEEIPTAPLVETQEMQNFRTLNEIRNDELYRGIFSYLLSGETNTNIPFSTDDIKYFHETFPDKDDYDKKIEKFYNEVVSDKSLDSEVRHSEWTKYVQAGLRLRNILYIKKDL